MIEKFDPHDLVIDKFTDEFAFLSNFYPIKIEFDGRIYPSVEHAYQAAKTFNAAEREQIRCLKSPYAAKKAGQKVTLQKNWYSISLAVMYNLNCKKFQNEGLGEKLRETWPWRLIEGNNWGDTFWGMCNGVGENHLGKILMQIRRELLENANAW